MDISRVLTHIVGIVLSFVGSGAAYTVGSSTILTGTFGTKGVADYN